MNAMTWFDHTTGSVWSQVWGQSIAGPLKGSTLDLIPASIVPWSTWKAEHPHTLAMTDDKDGYFSREETPRDGWVIGIALGEHSKAFYYPVLAEECVINDFVGPYPVAIYANPQTRNVHVYLRQVEDEILTLARDETDENLVDVEYCSRVGARGDLKGQALLLVPYISSFDWVWLDFHPNSEFYPDAK